MKVFPCNLKQLRHLATEGCQINLSTSVKDESELLRMLRKLEVPEVESERELISTSGHLWKHIHLQFIVVGWSTYLPYLSHNTKLNVFSQRTVKQGAIIYVLSGTLDVWREAVIEMLTQRFEIQLSETFDQILTQLFNKGYASLFTDYRRKKDRNGPYLEKVNT